MEYATKLIHTAPPVKDETGALGVPVYRTSTFHQKEIFGHQEFDYARSGNPTRKALEEAIAVLEGGSNGYAFASGIAAVGSTLAIFSAGDHIVICEDVYGGTFRLTTTILSRFGLEFTFVDASNLEAVKQAIRPNTKALYLETPSNPLLKVTDLRAASELAHEHELVVIVDNTFMTPYLQRPLELGADIVVHSATKFLGGHSDVLAGLVVTKTRELGKRVYAIQNGFGAVLGPDDSWLVLRGIRTLKVRVEAEQENARRLAAWLSEQPAVKAVYYPGLPGHPGYAVNAAQTDGPGCVLSFELGSAEQAAAFLGKLTLPIVGVSLGGVETIVSYPRTMSHASMPAAERTRFGISDALIRVSLGLEDVNDLIADFTQAL